MRTEQVKQVWIRWMAAALFALLLAFFAAGARAGASNTYQVRVKSSYLALRNDMAYERSNEIGQLYNGDTVELWSAQDSTYWLVYAPSLDKYGYVNKNYLIEVPSACSGWNVKVDTGYLALRNEKAYDSRNEIGELYTGDEVFVLDATDSTYWYVYAPVLDRYGYVNKDYLVSQAEADWTVRVDTGYLALRNAMAYDSRNEIGKLYTGDTVAVQDASDSTYWYVYSPKLDKFGYVNKNYLVNPDSTERTVRVNIGYLALRSAKAYDSRNEIGKLYTGDTVYVVDDSDSTYWLVYSPDLRDIGYVNKNDLY